VVIFDKTGTLTRGAPALSGVAVAPGVHEDDLFSRAAAETDSEHPLAKLIVAETRRRRLPLLTATQFEALPGRGWRPALIERAQLETTPELAKTTTAWAAEGKTVLSVVSDRSVLGSFAVEDEIRSESKEAVDELHRLGLRVAMITGDSRTVAESVARRIGISAA